MESKWVNRFIKSLEIKYAKEWGSNKIGSIIKNKITEKKTKYLRLGYTQSPRKVEMAKVGAAITEMRGLQAYDPKLHLSGISLGQAQLTPFVLSAPYSLQNKKIVCEGDNLHFVNNAAMQQMWDDIRRTCIVGLDLAHNYVEMGMWREITPETINYYIEQLNHIMPGAAIIQEYLVETHPALVDDCYVKVFTGDETLQDELDPQFVINIDDEFPDYQADQIKASIGKSTWQAIHIPTIVTRIEDGAATNQWALNQINTAFLTSYGMGSSPSLLGELAYSNRYACLEMGNMLQINRGRGINEPGGLCFGHMADIIQTSRKTPDDPCHVILQVASAASMLYDQIWIGGYLRGGVGHTLSALASYTDDIIDDFLYWGADYIQKKHDEFGKSIASLEIIKDIATEVTLNGLENYEKYPPLLEDHFGGSQRASVLSTAAGCATALATGSGNAGLSGWYLSMSLHKEAWGRIGDRGYDMQDQLGAANVYSLGSDEGCLAELRGPNYPDYAITEGHMGGYSAIVAAAHAGRKDAFCVNPLVKVCFADDMMNFDFADPRVCFGIGALREWDRCGGERTLIIPAK